MSRVEPVKVVPLVQVDVKEGFFKIYEVQISLGVCVHICCLAEAEPVHYGFR